jgi:hypothetical protein
MSASLDTINMQHLSIGVSLEAVFGVASERAHGTDGLIETFEQLS